MNNNTRFTIPDKFENIKISCKKIKMKKMTYYYPKNYQEWRLEHMSSPELDGEKTHANVLVLMKLLMVFAANQ